MHVHPRSLSGVDGKCLVATQYDQFDARNVLVGRFAVCNDCIFHFRAFASKETLQRNQCLVIILL